MAAVDDLIFSHCGQPDIFKHFGPLLYACAQSILPLNTFEQLWTASSHKQGLISVAELIDAEAQFEIITFDPDEEQRNQV